MATDAPPPGRSVADVVGVGVLAGAICAAVVVFWFVGAAPTVDGGPDPADGQRLSAIYDPPRSGIEAIYNKGDGQLFAGQATDPLVRHPEVIRGDPANQAYRYQRAMYGWLGWIASAGQPGAVAWALVAVTAASAVLLVVVLGHWLASLDRDPRWALLALLVPGVFVGLTSIGPEILGTALVVLGLRAWLRPAASSVLPAVACMAAAALCRETFLVFPAVVALLELRAGRPRRAFAFAAAAVPYLAWVAHLRVRLGAWPRKSGEPPLEPVPFGGLVDGVASWHLPDVVFAAVLAGLAAAALVRARRSFATPFVVVHLLLAAVMGDAVWRRFVDFGRVLLPMAVLALLVVLAGPRAPRPALADGASQTGPDRVPSGSPRPGIRGHIWFPGRHPRG